MLKFLENELPQGSQAWLDMRKDHITATMASKISGTNPFQKPDKLWKEMLGLIPPQPINPAMARGSNLEPEARKLYEQKSGEYFEPMCVISEQHLDPEGKHWIMASLDGADAFIQKGLELKCPGEKTHRIALSGVVPDYYLDQIQWQFLATENQMKIIDYVSYAPRTGRYAMLDSNRQPIFTAEEELVIIPVFPDLKRQQELLNMSAAFRQCLKDKIPPCGSEFESAAKLFVIADQEAKVANKKLDDAKKLLLQIANGNPMSGSGAMVSIADRKGSVDQEKVFGQVIAEYDTALMELMNEFNIPEERIAKITISPDRIEEIRAEHTGPSKKVPSVKAANDAGKVYETVILERKQALDNTIVSVINPDAAVSTVTQVSPVW
jgi:putative phage-type endonuclease